MIPIAMVPLRLSTLLSNCQSEKWHVHIWFRARHVNNLMLIDLHQSILMVEKQKWGGGAGGGGPIYLERSTSRFNGWRPVRSPKRFFFLIFFFFVIGFCNPLSPLDATHAGQLACGIVIRRPQSIPHKRAIYHCRAFLSALPPHLLPWAKISTAFAERSSFKKKK